MRLVYRENNFSREKRGGRIYLLPERIFAFVAFELSALAGAVHRWITEGVVPAEYEDYEFGERR
jgi:hypothetical protein